MHASSMSISSIHASMHSLHYGLLEAVEYQVPCVAQLLTHAFLHHMVCTLLPYCQTDTGVLGRPSTRVLNIMHINMNTPKQVQAPQSICTQKLITDMRQYINWNKSRDQAPSPLPPGHPATPPRASSPSHMQQHPSRTSINSAHAQRSAAVPQFSSTSIMNSAGLCPTP